MEVIKSSGIKQNFDPLKVLKVLEWATQDTNIDPYEFLDILKIHITDGMTTAEIQSALVKVASNLITPEEPHYQYVASNLRQFQLRKEVYGRFDPIPFYDHIKAVEKAGMYDKEILKLYSKEEIEYLETCIAHDRDFKFTYAGTSQLIDKYLVQDRSTGKIFESPQYAYMLIAMCLHQNEDKDNRLKYCIDFYNAASLQQISLPTPIMAGVRTPTRQFSSCVVIESGDSIDGIGNTSKAIMKYIAKRAGIGVNGGMIRAEGSKIGAGEVKHTGVIPFWKVWQSATGSTSNGGIRKGSATCFWPAWHLEFENLIVLKNNKGVEENRIRHMDYGMQVNNFLIKRFLTDDYITLFSPDVAGGKLYRAFFEDEALFAELYTKLESDPLIRKKRIRASELMSLFSVERSNTARIYPSNVDNVNNHGPWIRKIAPVTMSNLCMEIALTTRAMDSKDPLINLCTLSAFVLGKFDWKDQEVVNKLSRIMVRALDNLLDYQDYPVKEALGSKDYRSLGVGITNYAGFLAEQMVGYDEADTITHELFERLQYGLINASVELAEERGPAKRFKETKYGHGQLPIDWYNKSVDKLVAPNYVLNWEKLRERLIKFGIRNCTLTALMPCESSSQVSNSTNGFERPKGPVSVKQCKTGTYNQVVPGYENYGLFYDYLWESVNKEGNKPYLRQTCIAQKWVDQAISVNFNYNPFKYDNSKVPLSEIEDDLLFFWAHGGKNGYYLNTYDGAGEDDSVDESCAGCKL